MANRLWDPVLSLSATVQVTRGQWPLDSRAMGLGKRPLRSVLTIYFELIACWPLRSWWPPTRLKGHILHQIRNQHSWLPRYLVRQIGGLLDHGSLPTASEVTPGLGFELSDLNNNLDIPMSHWPLHTWHYLINVSIRRFIIHWLPLTCVASFARKNYLFNKKVLLNLLCPSKALLAHTWVLVVIWRIKYWIWRSQWLNSTQSLTRSVNVVYLDVKDVSFRPPSLHFPSPSRVGSEKDVCYICDGLSLNPLRNIPG